MNDSKAVPPLPDAQANDEEIRAYAFLLDRLGVGLVVHSADASIVLRNEKAASLLGKAGSQWHDETGRSIDREDHPLQISLATLHPVFERLLSIRNPDGKTTYVSINALPVFSGEGTIRRVLLTLADISEQRNAQSLNEKLATYDPLTGLLNQRHVMTRLENEVHRARRYGTPFTLAQIDIDLFLPLCADHGIQTGDVILTGVGKLIRESLREIDFAGRVGNDEFLLVLPNVSVKNALIGLERLRVLIEVATFTPAEHRVTISGGITEYTGENSGALIERCKSLLVQARNSGRNRYCLDADII